MYALFEFVELLAQHLGAFALGLRGFNFANGTLDVGIGGCQNILSLSLCSVNDFALSGAYVLQPGVVLLGNLVDALFLIVNFLSFVLPIFSVASDVEQIFVHIYVVAANNLRSLVDNLGREAYLSGNLNGKRTAWIAHRKLE